MHRSFITGLVYLVFCLCAHGSFADLSAGLVAYYPFEGNAHDASGNGHDGLEIGFLSYGNGIAGSCASFDGITTKIQVPHADDLSLDGTFTLSCWIKSEGTSAASGLLAKIQSDSPRNGYVLTANAELLSSDIRMNINKSWPAVQGTVHSTHSALDGHWHHLVGAYDGANLTLYLDGQIEMQLAYTNGLTINAMPLYIGWDPYSWSRYFNGEMDEVRIYKRALLLDEVQELFSDMSPHLNLFGESLTNTCVVAGESLTKTITISNAGNSDLDFSFCSPSAEEDNSLILHYTFDDDSGTTAVDQSGHGNDGLIMNDCVHVAGVHGQGLEIHGNSDHLSSAGGHVLLPEIDFNSIDEVTVALWVKEITMHHPHGERYITFGEIGYATNPGEIGIIKNSVGAIGYICGTSVSNHQFEPAQNVFVHYALTYSSGFMKTYRNGILIDTVPAELDVPDSQYAALGRHWWNNGYETSTRLTAVFDDVRIYNRALSDEEMVKLAGQGTDIGLVAYYPFEGNAHDASGNGHDGVEIGALSYGSGISGSCASFDGITTKIQVPHADDLSLDGTFTLSCWIKSEGTSAASGLLAKIQSDSPRNGYVLTANAELLSSDIRMNINKSWPAVQGTVHSTHSALDGHWHHLVGTYDETNLTLYLDSQIEMQLAYTNGLTVNTMPLYIGWDPYFWTRYYYGEMDEVRIYNRALLPDEVQELYLETTEEKCGFPEWLAVEPATGTVAPAGSMDVSVVYNASNMVAGDYVEHVLKLISNDPDYPELESPVSMWVIPSVPAIQPEPLCTIGSSNIIAWSYQEGPVEYWVEAMAVQHYAPMSLAGKASTPLGWDAQSRYDQNLDFWNKDYGWIPSTSCLFTDLRLNTIYMYRVKASVMTEIGRLEGDWSDWTLSCQVPVLPKGN